MSLLNQVLRDLDSRHASALERQRLPNAVRPLPAATNKVPWPKIVVLTLIALLLIAAFCWVVMLGPAHESVTAAVPAPAAAGNAGAGASTISHHDLKLDATEIFAFGRSAAASRTTSPKQSPEPSDESSGSIKGVPVAEFAATPDSEKSGDVVISRSGGDQGSEDYRRAQSMIEHGQGANAEPLLRQILAANPAQQDARQSLFNLLAAGRRNDEAASVLAEGLHLSPTRTNWAMNLARLQVEQGNNDAAWETLQLSLPYATNQADYQAFCGTVLQKLKKYPEATERYQAALRINPAEGRWWIGLALTLEAQGKQPEAREAFTRAQASGKLSPELNSFVEDKLRQ